MKTLTKKLLYVGISASIALPSLSGAQSSGYKPTALPGVTLISPTDFFTNQSLDIDLEKTIPEITAINANVYEDLEKFSWDLEKRGVVFGVGANQNSLNFFDVQSAYLITNPATPEADFGFSLRSRTGKLHFPTHDAAHLFIGQIGIRAKDLKNRSTRARLIKILSNIEGLASAWSNRYQLDRYADWKNGEREKTLSTQMPLPAYTDLMMSAKGAVNWVFNRIAKVVPGLSNPSKEPTLLSFDTYAKAQADYFLSAWYVDWSDSFKVGDDLDTLEKNIQAKIAAFKAGKFTDGITKPQQGVFETMQMRTEVMHLGRKLIELIHLSKEPQAQQSISSTDVREMKSLLADLIKLNDKLLAQGQSGRVVSDSEVMTNKAEFERLTVMAEQRFNIEKLLPLKLRVAHADYNNFWRNPAGIVLARPSVLQNGMSTATILSKTRELRIAKDAAEMKGEKLDLEVKLLPGVLSELERNHAIQYLENRKGPAVLTSTSADILSYPVKMNEFRTNINTQIESVFLPQALESEQLTLAERETIVDLAMALKAELNKQIDTVIVKYQEVFVDLNRDAQVKKDLFFTEGNVAVATHTILQAFHDILNSLEKGERLSASKKNLAILRSQLEQFQTGKEINLSFAEEFLRVKIPFKGKLVGAACSYITKFCIKNEKISQALGAKYLEETFLRPGTELKIIADQQMRDQISRLPENAVVLILPNHDYGILDGRIISRIADSLGVTRTMVLTNKEAYPHLKIRNLNDSDVFFSQDRFFNPMLKEMTEYDGGRIAMGYFPEGVIQYWNSQMPRTSKWGAFAYARRAAKVLKGKKPVYIMQIKSNGLDHVTNREAVDYKLTVVNMLKVPDSEVSQQDPWVQEQRAAFEAKANSTRGLDQIDLIDRGMIPGSNVQKDAPVRPYVTIEQHMQGPDSKPLDGLGLRCELLF